MSKLLNDYRKECDRILHKTSPLPFQYQRLLHVADAVIMDLANRVRQLEIAERNRKDGHE